MGSITVLLSFLKAVDENADLLLNWESYLEKVIEIGSKTIIPAKDTPFPSVFGKLLESSYAYVGSVPVPPCFEDVLWFISKSIVTIPNAVVS